MLMADSVSDWASGEANQLREGLAPTAATAGEAGWGLAAGAAAGGAGGGRKAAGTWTNMKKARIW